MMACSATTADDDEQLHEEFCITGFHCQAFCGSFYSGTGALDGQELKGLTAQLPQQLLGWFVCRRGSWVQPTMREHQVSAKLMAASPQAGHSRCALFMLFTPSQHHEGATLTLEQRLYHCSLDRCAPLTDCCSICAVSWPGLALPALHPNLHGSPAVCQGSVTSLHRMLRSSGLSRAQRCNDGHVTF